MLEPAVVSSAAHHRSRRSVATAFSGARQRVTGKVEEYGGRARGLTGLPEIILGDPSQVKVLK